MNKITLKNVKVNEMMSEETLCFSADVYENGKLIAHVSNRGIGGCNDIHPAKGLKYKDVAHLDNIDTECEIFTLAEEINIVKRNQTKAFVLKKDGKTYTRKNPKSFAHMKKQLNSSGGKSLYDAWLNRQLDKFKADGYEVMNTNL